MTTDMTCHLLFSYPLHLIMLIFFDRLSDALNIGLKMKYNFLYTKY